MLPRIDFCICTFNRREYLTQCLDALLPQIAPGRHQVTVVDNGSTDGTKSMVADRAAENSSLRLIDEPQLGLSHARNTAWQKSAADWILYLDDDSLPVTGFVEAAEIAIMTHRRYDAFGGPIDPVYNHPPKLWVPADYGSFALPFTDIEPMGRKMISGCCFLVKRETLQQLDGFKSSLGVRGHHLRYGEEIELQYRIEALGKQRAYVPGLRIGHQIRTEKLNVLWMWRSLYARRRDVMLFAPIGFFKSTLLLCRTLVSRIFYLPYFLFRASTDPRYPYRRALLDVGSPVAYRTGEWVGCILYAAGKGIK